MILGTTNSPLINGKNKNLFAQEVLNHLKQKKVTFRKCYPDYVEIFLGSSRIKVWFHGYRNGTPWRGGVGLDCIFEKDKVYMADPAIVAEMCHRHIALTNAE